MKDCNKRGQLTLWVIIALALAGSMILFFTLSKNPEVFKGKEINPEQFISSCVKRITESTLDKMLPQGGFVEPKNYVLYKGGRVVYMCENLGSFRPCVNQHPMLLTEMKNELERETSSDIGNCFAELANEVEKEDTRVSIGAQSLDFVFGPDKVEVNIDREVTITKQGTARIFDKFKVEIINPAYDLARITQEITSQEAKFCYFEYVGYMILYPRFDIQVDRNDNSDKIYIVKDKRSGKDMRFAIRGCVISAGI